MNTIKIYLKESGTVAELEKNFAMYVGAYQNKLIDVYVPKEVLYSNQNGSFNNTVKIGGLLTAPNGEQVTTDSYYMNYLRDDVYFDGIKNVNCAVFERVLPKELTVYPGTQQIVVNVVSVDNTDSINPVILQIMTSAVCNLLVENSSYLNKTEQIDLSQTDEIWSAITQNQQDIDKIFNDYTLAENYVGKITGIELPTNEQLTNFVEIQELRPPRNGDVVIFTLHISGATDRNFKYIYTHEGWDSWEIPPVEEARNGSLGLVQGTYIVDNTSTTLVDIQAGKIVNLYVLDNNNTYRNLRDYINLHDLTINDLIENKATIDFVKDYAMPRLFNDVYFIDSNGYSATIPESPASGIQYQLTTNAVGDFELFQIELNNTYEFELGSKNGYKNNIFVMSNITTDAGFRLTTEYKTHNNDWQLLNIEITSIVNLMAGNVSRLVFDSPFNYLGDKVVDFKQNDKIRQTLEVITQASNTTTFNIYSNEVYPSNFYLTSQSYTSSGSGGGVSDYNLLQNKPSLNTTNTTSQMPEANETLVGSINLHRISKTGALADAIQDATHRTVTDTEKETWNNTDFSRLTNVPQASTSQAGVIQIATDSEAEAGTNQTKAVNPKQLLTAIQGLGSVFTLKGSVPTASDLPSSGNTIGDVWYVVDESVGYIWLNDGTTTKWEQLGLPVNLSNYVEFSDVINALTSTATDKPLSAYQGKLLKDLYDNLNQKALKFPSTASPEVELVGIDDNGTQVMVQIDSILSTTSENPIKNNAVANALNQLSSGVTLSQVYPVGSIYMSVNSTSPASLFGGSWTQLQNRFLLGAGSSYSNGATGGSANAVVVAHAHSGVTAVGNSANAWDDIGAVLRGTSYYVKSDSMFINVSGEDGTGKNMPPYLVVYMWKRTG